MKQSIIYPKKAFQLLQKIHIALSVARHRHKHKMRPRREPNVASQYIHNRNDLVFMRTSAPNLFPGPRIVYSLRIYAIYQGKVTQQKLSLNKYRHLAALYPFFFPPFFLTVNLLLSVEWISSKARFRH